jgi:hypothetical protein
MRYYFDIRYGDSLTPDDEGLELTSSTAVQKQAIRSLEDALRYPEDLQAGDGAAHRISIEVRDDNGPVLAVSYTFEHGGHSHWVLRKACYNFAMQAPIAST